MRFIFYIMDIKSLYIYKEHLFIRYFHDKTDIKKLVSLNSTYFWLDMIYTHTCYT